MENETWVSIVTKDAPGGKEANMMAFEATGDALANCCIQCRVLKVPDIEVIVNHIIDTKYNGFPEEALDGLTVAEVHSKMTKDVMATITELNIETYEN